MNKKYFVLNEGKDLVSIDDIREQEAEKQRRLSSVSAKTRAISSQHIQEKETLKHTQGRVVIKADLELKNSHTFKSGQQIRLERNFNEFNRRITAPVQGIVISSEYIPEGSEVLISHNALHDTNRLFNYKPLSGITEASDVKYYSLPETDCFAWADTDGNMQPMKDFCFALRIFKPYEGAMYGVPPAPIKDMLYILTGEFKGQVVHTLKASDYEIIYQGSDGIEKSLIRCRHFENESNVREEIVAISPTYTQKVNENKILIGKTFKDCITLNEYNV